MAPRILSIPLACMLAVVSGCTISSSDEDLAASDTGSTLTQECTSTQIQQGLDALHANGVTGVLAEVDDGNRRVLARSGVARLGSEQPVPFNSRFRMGSNTKPFISVVMLQLVGEGALTLDDTVDKWLPGLVSGNGNDGKLITVRQLLQHTSGVYNYLGLMPWLATADGYLEHQFEHAEPEALVALALQHAPDFAPGAGWNYSNTNYVLAGLIIKSVTGHDWSSEVRSRILEPLGLRDTFNPGDEPGLPNPHAQAYEEFPGSEQLTDVTLLNPTWTDAAGALVTTTADLAKFWRALQGGSLLRPEQMAAMHDTVLATTFQPDLPGSRYGLGIMWFPTSCGEGYWSHAGDTLGFSTRNAVSDDGSRVAILSRSTRLADRTRLTALETDLFDQIMCADRIGR